MTKPLRFPGTGSTGLAVLERRLQADLEALELPPRSWVPMAAGPDGAPVKDVVVIGGGLYGIAASIALLLEGVANIALVDRAEDGEEGPWVTFARMPTLRSPKTLPGPAGRIAALTFRAWYEASYGIEAWEDLYKPSNQDWQAYLVWLRRTMKVPYSGGTAVNELVPANGLVRVETTKGRLWARRVVLATGRNPDAATIPDFLGPGLRPGRAAHTCDMIDFAALAGREVAVIGGGASAWDNAATALEAGARVTMYVRRPALPQVNKGRAPAGTSPGMLRGWSAMPDALRWRMAHYAATHPAPPPHETVFRTLARPGFELKFEHAPVAAQAADAGVRLLFANGARVDCDFLILGTGFSPRLEALPLLAPLGSRIVRWGDRYAPPPDLADETLAAGPYLGDGFELEGVDPEGDRDLSRIHVFSPVGHTSMGWVSTDIPGVNVGADILSRAIVQHLALENAETLHAEVEAFTEAELIDTPFYDAAAVV